MPFLLRLSLLAVLLIFFNLNVKAEAKLSMTGTIYDSRKYGHKTLFTWQHHEELTGENSKVRNVYLSPEGKEVVIERVDFVAGKLQTLELDNNQTGNKGKIEIKDGTVHFSYTSGGKTKEDTEKLKDNFIVGPTLTGYLQKNWQSILKGEKVEVRMGVIERLETVGFEFKKDKDVNVNGQPAVVVKMKASSFIIAAIVDPLYFTFVADGSRLLEYEGRMTPKIKDKDNWKDFDGYIVYSHTPPEAAATSDLSAEKSVEATTEKTPHKKAKKTKK